MKAIKQTAALLVGGALVLGALAGCKGNNGLYTATVDDMNGRLDRDAADLVVTFENAGYGAQWMVDLKNAFQEKTGKSVYLEGEKGISQYAPNRWATGTDCSDVYFMDDGHSPVQQIAQGYVEDLSDLMTSEVEKGKTVGDLLYTSFKDYGKVTTSAYSGYYYLPWTIGVGSLFYNTDILQQAGWNTPPTTYEELKTLVQDINRRCNGVSPFIWSKDHPEYWQFVVETWFVQLVGIENYAEYEKMENLDFYDKTKEYTNPNTGEKINFAAKKQEALSLLEGLIVNPLTHDIINASTTDIAQDFIRMQTTFIEGKAAMIPNGSWLEQELAGGGIPQAKLDKIRVMPVPFAPNARKGANDQYIEVNNTLSYNYCMIPTKAQHKDLAKEFLLFTLTQENLENFSYETGGFRPYSYDLNKASLSYCAQDAYEIITRAERSGSNFTFNPKSELAFRGQAAMWYYNPFGNMLGGDRSSRPSAETCIDREFTAAKQRWQAYN